jgi:hypothetical protein
MSGNRHGKHRKSSETQAENEFERESYWRNAHKDWRVWVAVGLMLVAMLTYVMSMDESVRPGVAAGQPMPAASGP